MCELEAWSGSHHGIHPQRLKSRCCPKKKISPSVCQCCLRRQAMHSVPVTALELLHRHPCPFWDSRVGPFRPPLQHYNSIYNFTTRYYRITTRTVVGFVSCRNFCRAIFFCSWKNATQIRWPALQDHFEFQTSVSFSILEGPRETSGGKAQYLLKTLTLFLWTLEATASLEVMCDSRDSVNSLAVVLRNVLIFSIPAFMMAKSKHMETKHWAEFARFPHSYFASNLCFATDPRDTPQCSVW